MAPQLVWTLLINIGNELPARGRVRKTPHQRVTAQHLSFGLRLTSEPVSQVVEDIKNRRSEKIKIFPSRAAPAKAGGLKAPDAFSPLLSFCFSPLIWKALRR